MVVQRVLTSIALCSLFAFTSAQAIGQAPKPKQEPHAFLGIMVAPPEQNAEGVQIRDVMPNSPAAKAGLKKGDILVSVNDQKIKDGETFLRTIGAMKPGDKAAIKVTRDGKEQTLTATLGEMPKPTAVPTTVIPKIPAPRPTAILGIRSDELTANLKSRLNVPVDTGVVVDEVLPQSPAAKAGLMPDDVITAIDDKPVKNPDELRKLITSMAPGKEVTVQFYRGKDKMTAKATLQEERSVFAPGEEASFPFPSLPLDQSQKIQELERHVKALEKRLDEMEKKLNRTEKQAEWLAVRGLETRAGQGRAR